MDLGVIKRRVQKLLKLSESPNEEEAASALRKANELMEEYHLTETRCRTYVQEHVKSTKRRSPWRGILSGNVAWLYGVMSVQDSFAGERLFIGEPLEAFLAAEMYQYLCKSVERIAKQSIRRNAKYKYRESFKYGCAVRIANRIRDMGERCSWASEREEKINAVDEYANSIMTLSASAPKEPSVNAKAYQRGLISGDGVSLVRQATGSGGRMIGGY